MGAFTAIAATAASAPLPAFPGNIHFPALAGAPVAADIHNRTFAPPAPTMSRGEFALHWSRTKSAMVGCDDAVADARHALAIAPEMAGPALRKVQERCAAAAVDIGMIEPPASARGRALVLLQEARDACQRSMIEKQMAMEAIERLMASGDVQAIPETRIRTDAIDRSSLACGATFTVAGSAANVSLSDFELLSWSRQPPPSATATR